MIQAMLNNDSSVSPSKRLRSDEFRHLVSLCIFEVDSQLLPSQWLVGLDTVELNSQALEQFDFALEGTPR